VARNVALVAFGVIVGVLGGAALQLHAAAEGGATEADSPPEPAPVAVEKEPTPEPPYGPFDRLAQCESGSDWHNTRNPIYSGGLQFDRSTWIAYGGGAYAPVAAGATRGQQIEIATRLRAARGYQPWPVCSRVVGLR